MSKLFNLYISFMEGNEVRHGDLINPIKAFALQTGISPSNVLKILQSMYQPI